MYKLYSPYHTLKYLPNYSKCKIHIQAPPKTIIYRMWLQVWPSLPVREKRPGQMTQRFRHFRQSITNQPRITPEGFICIIKGFSFLTNAFP